MYAFLIIIHIIASLVLIAVILLQAGRGGGLNEAFGGSSTQTIFGTSATAFLKKATSVCAIVFLTTSLTLAIYSSRRSKSIMEKVRITPMQEVPIQETEENVAPAGQDDAEPLQ